ncbi:MAG TPA: hypothetical protein ENK96_03940, partial [Desulfobulbaceae bacterium]|nr:hypothetical protein [Desulfobulbaceae bacterium]
MNYTLIAAIVVALLILCFFLLRKSSKNEKDSTIEAPPPSAGEGTGDEVVEEQDESIENILEQEIEPGSEVERTETEPEEITFEQAGDEEETEIISAAADEERTAGEVSEEQDESIEDILEQEIKAEPEEEQVETEPEEIESESISESSQAKKGADEIIEEVVAAAIDEEASIPTLTIEIYETRLRQKEKQQQKALAAAISEQDDIRRDHLQIELVAITDKLALLSDSYNEDIQWRKEALAALEQFREEVDPSEYVQARESLLSGETETAEQVFSTLIEKNGPFAAQAAFHSGRLAEGRVDLYLAMERYRTAVDLDTERCDYLRAAG